MTDAPPAPLTTPAMDISGITGFVLDTQRLLGSETWAMATGDEAKAAVTLWARAWTQVPAGSVPADDRILANWCGHQAKSWARIKDVAMRGFILCSDGRLYHRVLCEDVVKAHTRRVFNQKRASSGGQARAKQRLGDASSTRQEVLDSAPSPSPSPVPIPVPEEHTHSTHARWPYERSEWGQRYVQARCKIGGDNWPAWKALADEHGGHDAVLAAAAAVPATKRWPSDTEEVLRKANGQRTIGSQLKTEKIIL